MNLTRLGLLEAAALLRRKAVSPVELAQACIERIERWNPVVNAFITVTAEQALQQARVAEAQIQRGHRHADRRRTVMGCGDIVANPPFTSRKPGPCHPTQRAVPCRRNPIDRHSTER